MKTIALEEDKWTDTIYLLPKYQSTVKSAIYESYLGQPNDVVSGKFDCVTSRLLV